MTASRGEAEPKLSLGFSGTEALDPRMSADRTAVWADADGRLWVATDDGDAPRLVTGPLLDPARVAFSPDGERVQVWRSTDRAVHTYRTSAEPVVEVGARLVADAGTARLTALRGPPRNDSLHPDGQAPDDGSMAA